MAAYLIAGLTSLTDPGAFEHWGSQVRRIIAAHGGTFLTAGPAETVMGTWQPHAVALIAFPSMEELHECLAASEQPEVQELRERTMQGDIVIVAGL